MDSASTWRIVDEEWGAALPSLQGFVRIENLSIAYDPAWATNGLLEKACAHVMDWVKAQDLKGCTVELLHDEGYSPFVVVEVAGTAGSPRAASTFVMYGHLDKQPHGPGWEEGVEPTGGLLRDGKVYGRGSADDGYACYSCVIALKALQRQGIAHPRVMIVLETSEESGSPHLGHYIEKLSPRIGQPAAVFCMDSVVEDYGRLWLTSSLRGVVMGRVEVGVLRENLHSGFGGGLVPDAFRVARQLLARVEDPATGKILVPELKTKIPVDRQQQMKDLSVTVPRPDLNRIIPWREGAQPQNVEDPFAMHLANTWEPCMTVVGFSGLPDPSRAGNVLSNQIAMQLSFRIPPLVDATKASEALTKAFETDPPYGATVKADFSGHCAPGWNAEELRPSLETALNTACKSYFDGKDIGFVGVGATIPLLQMLSAMFPSADLICTGVLGPGTNMHGPNENLPVEYTKKVTACIAHVMGILEPDQENGTDNWPEDVPRPVEAGNRKRKLKATFCFNRPDVPIGQCLCCL